MIKSKRFVFVAIIMVAVLLVVGNWVIPVQANNVDIVTSIGRFFGKQKQSMAFGT